MSSNFFQKTLHQGAKGFVSALVFGDKMDGLKTWTVDKRFFTVVGVRLTEINPQRVRCR
jgi:hypothetical protein